LSGLSWIHKRSIVARRTIRALIFDFDGLIIDTESCDYQSWCEVYEAHGCTLPIDIWTKAVGRGFDAEFEPFSYLEEQIGRTIDRDLIREQRRQRDYEIVMGLPVLPGVEALLRDARQLNMKLAVASSSSRSWVEPHLARLNLLDYFDAIRSSDDVSKTKPDPELFLSACKAVGVHPHEAIVFEDSPNGVLAANRAGIFVVAVPNPLTARMVIERPDMKVASLADISLSDLLDRLQQDDASLS
jgi:HAD superfamily hydrolase (TIGR01509 family)